MIITAGLSRIPGSGKTVPVTICRAGNTVRACRPFTYRRAGPERIPYPRRSLRASGKFFRLLAGKPLNRQPAPAARLHDVPLIVIAQIQAGARKLNIVLLDLVAEADDARPRSGGTARRRARSAIADDDQRHLMPPSRQRCRRISWYGTNPGAVQTPSS